MDALTTGPATSGGRVKLDIDDFAVRGERGVDLFRRRQDPASRRARFVCIATAISAPPPGQKPPPQAMPAPPAQEAAAGRLLMCHEPAARAIAAELWQAVARLDAQPALHHPFSLGDATGYPGTEGLHAAHELFVYVEFFRERQLAAHSLDAFATMLNTAPPTVAQLDPGELAGTLRQALDYNMIARGSALWPRLQPLLAARAAVQGLPQELSESTGYALRLMGDLRLRAGAAAEALDAFETALQLGDNPFRRRRAIEAALAAGRADTASRHIAAYGAHGALPDDLLAMAQEAGIEPPPPASSRGTATPRRGT